MCCIYLSTARLSLLQLWSVENFAVEDGKIVNKLSGQKFSVLVLPMCEILPLEAAKLCEKFVNAGGKVIALNEVPFMGFIEKEDEELNAMMSRVSAHANFVTMNTECMENVFGVVSENIPHPVKIVQGCAETMNYHPAYPNYLIDPYIHTGEDISGVMFNRYCKDGHRHTLFMNYGDKEETIRVRVETTGAVPTLWDTFTGEISDVAVISQENRAYIVEMKLPNTHGVILVTE